MGDSRLEEVWAALDRRLDPAATSPLIVALSGGGDSVALLRLTVAWARARGRPVLAVTVDHGLHPEGAVWTAFAEREARALGCAWRDLCWSGPKPATGIPAAARAARHALLADAARDAGARVIVTGHTADDVLEGELMRVHDAPTLGRLRQWSPSPAWPEGRGVFLLRPLLGVRREALRVWLREQGADWLDDPTNDDPRYARTRARAALFSSPAQRGRWLGPQDRDGGGTSEVRTDTCPLRPDARASAHLPRFAGEEKSGVLVLERSELAPRVVAAAVLCAAGTSRPLRGEALVRLSARLNAGEAFTTTLAGARLQAASDAVRITREPGERNRGGMAPHSLPQGAPIVWDGRFEMTAHAPGLTVSALAGHTARLPAAERARLQPLPPAARAALPVLIDASGAVSLPAPFGSGPALARCLVRDRFEAALGAIPDERALIARDPPPPHGAARTLILS